MDGAPVCPRVQQARARVGVGAVQVSYSYILPPPYNQFHSPFTTDTEHRIVLAPARYTRPGILSIRNETANCPKNKLLAFPDYTCYRFRVRAGAEPKSDEPRDPAFPLHLACINIFSLYATGKHGAPESRSLDREALYLALYALLSGSSSAAKDDGAAEDDATGIELRRTRLPLESPQHCRCEYHKKYRPLFSLRGYELFLADPLPSPSSSDDPAIAATTIAALRDLALATPPRPTQRQSQVPTHKIRSDPFTTLPLEILYLVTSHLEDGHLLALCAASAAVHAALHPRSNPTFWWHRIRRGSMPWLVEADALLSVDMGAAADGKKLLRAVPRATRPEMPQAGRLCDPWQTGPSWQAMTGPLVGVANRRRIWGLCEREIGREYERMVREKEKEMEKEGGRVGLEEMIASIRRGNTKGGSEVGDLSLS